MTTLPPRPVLYAEDEDNDVFLMERAFTKAKVQNPLRTVPDGAAAIRYLSGGGDFADRQRFPLPCLILLDLNLPRQSGLDVLKWVRARPELDPLPVVIFTSSSQERDLRTARALGANAYFVKPPGASKLVEIVATLRDTCLTCETPVRGWLDIAGNHAPPVP